MENLERAYFVDFPKCEKLVDLQHHLAQWMQLKGKYGTGLPQEHLIAMLWKILPDDVREEIKRQRTIRYDLDGQIAYLYGELGDNMDERLSRWNLTKLQQQLKYKAKNTTGIHALGTSSNSSPEPAPSPPVPDFEAFNANLERMVNAAVTRGQDRGRTNARTPPGSRNGSSGSQRGNGSRRTPNPKFKGCWCCGEEGHDRKTCPRFAAIRKANGGKVPKDYVGAYEKSMGKTASSKPVTTSVVSVSPLDWEEHQETVKLWPLLRNHAPIPVANQYDAFDESDEEDEETTIVNALSSLTPNIQFASAKKRSQKNRKKKDMDIAYLNSIARRVKSGEIQLPNVDLDTDDEYQYVWALVDSGAGANVARREHFPNWKTVGAPKISLTVANGETMPNSGAGEVASLTRDGKVNKRVFYEAPVEMPILSVTELAREGELGSEVRFRIKDGVIIDNLTGKKCQFVKRKGVYFMRLYFPKDAGDPSVFARPDM